MAVLMELSTVPVDIALVADEIVIRQHRHIRIDCGGAAEEDIIDKTTSDNRNKSTSF